MDTYRYWTEQTARREVSARFVHRQIEIRQNPVWSKGLIKFSIIGIGKGKGALKFCCFSQFGRQKEEETGWLVYPLSPLSVDGGDTRKLNAFNFLLLWVPPEACFPLEPRAHEYHRGLKFGLIVPFGLWFFFKKKIKKMSFWVKKYQNK